MRIVNGAKWIAAIAAAIAVAGTAAACESPRRGNQPIPSTWDAVAREVTIPGVDFALDKRVILVDAAHAWAYVDACPNSYPQVDSCRSALGITADGGKTWRRVNMPGKTSEREFTTGTEVGPRWLPLNASTLSLVTRDEIYVTRDQGNTWNTYPMTDPPQETQLAANLADNFGSRNGDFAYLCPGASPVERPSQSCTPVLTRLGTGPVVPQPSLPGWVRQGGDGRIWLTRATGENEMRIAVSADGGKSWTDLPPTTIGGLQLSPDGSRAIIAHHIKQWRLDGQRWPEFPGMYGDDHQMSDAVVRNDGQIVGVLNGKGVYLSASNEVTEIAGMPAVDVVTQLPDGTVVFHTWIRSSINYVGTRDGWFTLTVHSER